MMRSFIQRAGALALSGLLAVSFVGCSKGGNAQSGSLQSSSSASQKPIKLQLITWANAPSVAAIQDLDTAFTQKYPNITVTLTSVDTNAYEQLRTTRLQANNADIISQGGTDFVLPQVSWAVGSQTPAWQNYVNSGDYVDLTNESFISNWSTGAKAATYNGKTYGVFTGANIVTGVFYSKKIFTQLGLSVPVTWSDFETVCNTLKSKKIAPMTCGGADSWPYTMISQGILSGVIGPDNMDAYSKGFWDGSSKFTDSSSKTVFERLDFLNKNMEKGFMGITYADVISRFVAGKAAMLPDGSWEAASIEKADPNFAFGYFPMPGTTADKTEFAGKFDLGFAINAHSSQENITAAKEWFAFLSDKTNYAKFVNTDGMIPTMDVPVTDSFIKGITAGVTKMPLTWELHFYSPKGVGGYAVNYGYNGNNLASAGGKVATPDQLAELTQKDWDSALSKAKS